MPGIEKQSKKVIGARYQLCGAVKVMEGDDSDERQCDMIVIGSQTIPASQLYHIPYLS